MDVKGIIALVIILVIVISVITYFTVKRYKYINHVKSLLNAHQNKIKLLLGKDKLFSYSDLSNEELNIILSLSDNDYNEWSSLINRIQRIGSQYPYTLYEFINEHITGIKYRNSYKKHISNNTPTPQKVKVAIDSMLLDELRLIDSDSEDTWKHRDSLREQATSLISNYPDGYKTYCDIRQNNKPQHGEVVRDKRQIIELQSVYECCKNYEGWEDKQNDFSSSFWQILKDVRSQDGRYVYDVTFNKPTRKGSQVSSTFKVWQGFCNSFSSYLLDRQTDDYLDKYQKLSEFKNRGRYFYDHVYDEIFEIIKRLNSDMEGSVYVIMVDKCKRNWTKESYDYHYKRLRQNLDESNINRLNFRELPSIKDPGDIKGIFIFDFVTSNEELKNNCKLIIEHFNKSVPLLGYYSMEKEYDEDELLELAKSDDSFLKKDEQNNDINEDDEESWIEFIKNCMLQINKHPFYSYIAIPNSWIGSAAIAKETKKTWLTNPEQYFFDYIDKPGFLSGKYSIDSKRSCHEMSIPGNKSNIDDTAKFTYLLFKDMGVLSMFKKNCQKAIDYMNEDGFLANH